MKSYYRIMLGSKSSFAKQCYEGSFIGANFDIDTDLANELTDNWREFNQKFIPIWLSKFPNKNKVSAGLSMGALWTVSKGINKGDCVLCPNGSGSYYVGEIVDNYSFQPGNILPHQRKVKWGSTIIERSAMSDNLKNSAGSIGTVSDISKYAEEIETLISGNRRPIIVSTDSTVEDPAEFAMEEHLENFLVQNWSQTEIGKYYDIFKEDEELVGQQYPTDTGRIDILAISKDKNTLLVVELKKGRVSDNVVGQIQRYMGFVKEELAEENQHVKGVIIGLKADPRIKRALVVTNNIEYYNYQVSFKLVKG